LQAELHVHWLEVRSDSRALSQRQGSDDQFDNQLAGVRVAIDMWGAFWQAEALHKQFQAKKHVLEEKGKQAVQEKYGNAAKPVDEKAAALLFGQSERYVEYNAQVGIHVLFKS
jgi:Pre-mRNA splicing Prp18-interacting factor